MKKNIALYVFLSSVVAIFLSPVFAMAVDVEYESPQEPQRARILEIVSEEVKEIPGTGTMHLYQVIKAEILDGEGRKTEVNILNDYVKLDKGDVFYFKKIPGLDGPESYTVTGIDRRAALFVLVALFVGVVLVFGRMQGLRSLLALLGSFLIIFYLLIPGLLNGWNPFFASFVVASGILFAAIFFTHGFNRVSSVAFGGTVFAVALTGFFAVLAVKATNLSGFAAEESVYLNFNTDGGLNFTALLLGAIIIGALGVLDDIAITQSAVVDELYDSKPDMRRAEAYQRALRVGREHVGALVNTLVLAYTGAALPLLMLLYVSSPDFSSLINMEVIATEIVRVIAGSIGLILTVPIVTAFAVYFLKDHAGKSDIHHGHSHGA
ncbi:MAG: YibE/F family protein [bacterium]|nr:YibE/F family protein [bacterium]